MEEGARVDLGDAWKWEIRQEVELAGLSLYHV